MSGILQRQSRMLLLLCWGLLLQSGWSRADEKIPLELQGVGVTQHRGEGIPLGLQFSDDTGKRVTLGEYFQTGRPVILNLAYYSCPMLCTYVLNGMTQGLKGVAWSPGVEFEVVSVSIDPRDTVELARAKKANYVNDYGRPGTASGWHFLTGTEENIKALAAAVGFSYRWDEAQKGYAHAAVIFMLTSEGTISQYLEGIAYSPRDLRLGLLEASQGKIGSQLDQFLLFCFHYDPVSKKYVMYATNVMRLGGCITAFLLGGMLVGYWRRERRAGRERSLPASGGIHGAQ